MAIMVIPHTKQETAEDGMTGLQSKFRNLNFVFTESFGLIFC